MLNNKDDLTSELTDEFVIKSESESIDFVSIISKWTYNHATEGELKDVLDVVKRRLKDYD